VDGSFPEPPLLSPKSAPPHDYDLILGETDAGYAVTLIGCREFSSHSTGRGRTSQTVVTDRGLIGRTHIEELPELRFGQAELRFAHLGHWAPEVTAMERDNGVRWRSALAAQAPKAVISSGKIHLSLHTEEHSTRREETIREVIAFAYQAEDTVDLQQLADRVWRPLQDLMTFVALESSALVGLRVRRGRNAADLWNDPWFDVLVSGHTVGSLEQDTRRGFLFRLNQFAGGFEKLMPAWFALFDEFTLPLSLLLASDYAPFTYVDRRFAEAVQAVEGYHRATHKEGPSQEHRERVQRILAVVGERDRAWVMDRLLNSHEPPLLERLKDVLQEAGRPLQTILAAWPDLPQAVRDTRNAQTHLVERKDKRISDPARMMDAVDILRWALRGCLLRRLGFDGAAADGLLETSLEFQWVRRRA